MKYTGQGAKGLAFLALFFIGFNPVSVFGWQRAEQELNYNRPAAVWTEALPLGNGTLGAMIYGRPAAELIQLNDATLWSGGPVPARENPEAFLNLAPLRMALAGENYMAAYVLAKKMQGSYSESYLPMADLHILQTVDTMHLATYRRSLDISRALHTVSFDSKGVQFTRETFISAPDQVLVMRFGASQRGALNLTIGLSSQLSFHTHASGRRYILDGRAPSHASPNYVTDTPVKRNDAGETCKGMRFEVVVEGQSTDGKVTADSSGLHISGASYFELRLVASTSFNGFDKCPVSQGVDEKTTCERRLSKLNLKTYESLRLAHLIDFQKLYGRLSLHLGSPHRGPQSVPALPERLVRYSAGAKDSELETLYFNYGRYLLLSSSRTPGVPANLQGIWNKELRPPWSSNYTTNINLQMNYWPAGPCNLSELASPLLDFIEHLARTGHATAAEFYHLDGWVVHHNSDIWALSNPVGDHGGGDPLWANWYMGSAWLSRHLWENYQYTGDTVYLRTKAYPLMKSACRFMLAWLQSDSSGHLFTSPSSSPENSYYYAGGKSTGLTRSSTMDMAIVRDLFENTRTAGQVLATKGDFSDSLGKALAALPPYQRGSKGQLLEWTREYVETDPHHRHNSHLYGLYPGHSISFLRDTNLTLAAKKTLELRGDAGTGWSLAWKVNLWARLGEGNHAYQLFRRLLHFTEENKTNYAEGGGVYANLFDAHPPFQIDGNFGGTAGVTEMLAQNTDAGALLLAALPQAWAEGRVSGLGLHGAFVLDMDWKNSRLVRVRIFSRRGNVCRLLSRYPVTFGSHKGLSLKTSRKFGLYALEFKTARGKSYTLPVPEIRKI